MNKLYKEVQYRINRVISTGCDTSFNKSNGGIKSRCLRYRRYTIMSETYEKSLGDYEKEVLLHLDKALTLEQAEPLQRGVVASKLVDIISDCHLHGFSTSLCVIKIEVLRLELLQDVTKVTVCNCSMLKQQSLI